MNRNLLTLLFIVFARIAFGQSLEDRFGEAYRDLPEELYFGCETDDSRLVSVFDREFRVPDNFSFYHEDSRSFEWLVSLSGGLFSTPFAGIEIENIEVMITQSYSWPAVSEHSENSLGARISLMEPDEDEDTGRYTLFLVRNDENMHITSLVPIDWESIFECFT